MLSRLSCSLLLFVVVVKKMSIIHTFSCRLYGLRSYKKQIKKIASISIESKIEN